MTVTANQSKGSIMRNQWSAESAWSAGKASDQVVFGFSVETDWKEKRESGANFQDQSKSEVTNDF